MTFDKACEIATQIDLALKDTEPEELYFMKKKTIKRREQSGRPNKGRNYQQKEEKNHKNPKVTKTSMKCTCCGRTNHTFFQCKYKEYSRNLCKRVGQLAYNCKKKGEKTHYLKEKDTSDDELAESFNRLFHLKEQCQQINRVGPIKVKLEIEGKIINMELDMGASVLNISEYEYKKKFGEIKLETDRLRLQYYTSETVDTLGHIKVNIKYKNKKFKGNWYVLKGQGSIFG